ncbi:MxaK protein [Ideonella sp. 4Y16]|uniref:MxaK protein n=1 Tax=Ideonella alba TaxID=2824118 RepID=UPI001B377594|nr:MxaK protein [Ideonella alba]MBQ0942045.1 MxaK protein [Ideonella alba]
MGLTPRTRTRRLAPWALLLLAAALLAQAAWQARQRQALRQVVQAELAAPVVASAASAVPAGAAPAQRFARAQRLAADGQLDPALGLYRALQDDPLLGPAARFNGANALMRQAVALRDGGQADAAYPMVELAKEGYRELLRRDPGDDAARYNLERALRLNPEEDAPDLSTAGPARGERAATTMRAISQGLP